jgi:hypothetical protein
MPEREPDKRAVAEARTEPREEALFYRVLHQPFIHADVVHESFMATAIR